MTLVKTLVGRRRVKLTDSSLVPRGRWGHLTPSETPCFDEECRIANPLYR